MAIDAQINTAPTAPNDKFLSPQEMSPEQLSTWERDGKMVERAPEPEIPETSADDADSAPAKPAEQVASTEALSSPASEPGKPELKAKGKGLKARVDQLADENTQLSQRLTEELRRRKELRAELERESAVAPPRREPAAPVDSAPDADALKKEIARIKALPGAPKHTDFEDLDDYTAAMAMHVNKHLTEQVFAERDQASARSAEQRDEMHAVTTRLAKQYEEHPELVEQVAPDFLALVPSRLLPPGQKPTVLNFIKDQAMYECEHTLAMGAYLSSPEGRAEAARMCDRGDGRPMSPGQVIRWLALKDASFVADAQDAPNGNNSVSVHVSKAPPPPPVAGRKTAAPSDPMSAALKNGDFRAFDDLENARLLASKGKR